MGTRSTISSARVVSCRTVTSRRCPQN
jgi:hypothetical protein